MRNLLFFFLQFVCYNCWGATYYVSSKAGNGNFNGLSASKPKKTIQEAANLTEPGDTVLVMNGTYSNDCPSCNVVDIPNSGTSNRYIVYMNYKNHRPVIRFNGWAGFSVRNGVSYIEIKGFEIVGNNKNVSLANAKKQPGSCATKKGRPDPLYNGNGIVIDGRGGKHPHHIRLMSNTIHDCGGGGIGASQADYIHVERNTIYNNGWYSLYGNSGISFYQFWNYDLAPGYHNIIRANKCFKNRMYVPWFSNCKIEDGNGIIIDDFQNKQNASELGSYKSRTLIENNICWYNGGTGIHSFQSDHVDMINNTAYCNSQSTELDAGQILAGLSNDIRIINNILVSDLNNRINSNYQNTRLVYENNLHYNITKADKRPSAIISPTCVVGFNPLFRQAGKSLTASFSLKPGSPAINKGSKYAASRADYSGKMRQRGASDIGAYEY